MLAAECGLTVHAFEPGKEARSILQENAKLNDFNVVVHPFALDNESDEKTLSVTGRTGNRTIVSGGEGDLVKTKRGDEVSAASPDVIKIDVEGLELRVLDGLADILDQCRLCYVEVHDESEIEDVEQILIRRGLTEITHISNFHTIVKAQQTE